MANERVLAHQAGVPNARPYGVGGNVPADAVVTARRPHANTNSRQYVSDVPFEQSYNDRPTCQGTRTDGHPCKAKAEPGAQRCGAHKDQ